MSDKPIESLVSIQSNGVRIEGALGMPAASFGVVLFAHGSGSSRHSPRNKYVADKLREAGLATLLVDLLSVDEDVDYSARFDIELLTRRLADAANWLSKDKRTAGLPIGLFGASTGAAAALEVAARIPERIAAVVSRGGRPDLVPAPTLRRVKAPTLIIVGARDHGVIELNEQAHAELTCTKQIELVPGATHLFEERGALETVAQLASRWFVRHLAPAVVPTGH
jgi:putative phosphoribosyl transferase